MYSRRAPCEDEGRDQALPLHVGGARDASAVRGQAWGRFSCPAFRRNQPCQYLDLEFLAFRTVGHISAAQAPQSVVLCYTAIAN